MLALTRLKRTDPRTGWLIAVGGAFLTIAVAFSRAEGIFHPYYVSQLAPFTAALVGAAVATMLKSRIVAAAAILAGVATEMLVAGSDVAWVAAVGVGAAVLLASDVLSAARPHAGRHGRRRGAAAHARRVVGADARARDERDVPGRRLRADRRRSGRRRAARRRGDMFGGDTSSVSAALEYAQANGGGTIAVSSQSGAAGSLITSGADVAAIGGFSGRESQVSIEWLADAVEDGRIRYVLDRGRRRPGQRRPRRLQPGDGRRRAGRRRDRRRRPLRPPGPGRRAQVTVKPPSTVTAVPVIQPASGEASQRIVRATSSGSPRRPTG